MEKIFSRFISFINQILSSTKYAKFSLFAQSLRNSSELYRRTIFTKDNAVQNAEKAMSVHSLFFASERSAMFLPAWELSFIRSHSYSCMRRICSSECFVLRRSPMRPYLIERQSIMLIEVDYSRNLCSLSLSLSLAVEGSRLSVSHVMACVIHMRQSSQ